MSHVTVEMDSAVVAVPIERPAGRLRRSVTGSHGSLPYFVAGPENRLVAFVSTADTPLRDHGNPLLLIGPSGCGKTIIAGHVAAREAARLDAEGLSSEVHSLVAVDFARQFAEAVAAEDLPPLRQKLDQAPVLVVDDLHLIVDKPRAQEELASRIESRTERGRATILTCRRLPSEVRGIKPVLASRVLPGLTVPIALPRGESRTLLLNELATHLDVDLPNELLEILDVGLDQQLPVRGLEAALKQIRLHRQMTDGGSDLGSVQAVIDSVGGAQTVSLESIATEVARYFRIKPHELRSSSRRQNLVRARSLAMLLSRRLTTHSMQRIGEHYGGRDHTTVLHALRKSEAQLDANVELRRAYDELFEKLDQS